MEAAVAVAGSTTSEKILVKYELPADATILGNPPTKYSWKQQVTSAVNSVWKHKLIDRSMLYSTLDNLNCKLYVPGKIHPLILATSTSSRDVTRLAVKFKLVSGTYILQTNRAKFNKVEVDPTCLLCGLQNETAVHFMLECEKLHDKRQPLLSDVASCCRNITNRNFEDLASEYQVKIILDPSFLLETPSRFQRNKLQNMDYHTRRLCYILHCERHKQLLTNNINKNP